MKTKPMLSRLQTLGLAGMALVVVAGCGDTTRPSSIGAPPQGTARSGEIPKISAEAGIPVGGIVAGAPDVMAIAKTMGFGSRSNAFALMANEVTFDREQTAARFVSEGGWRFDYEEPEADTSERIERVPVPRWRLAGVLVAESVTALLDMGGQVIEIRPGMTIPGTTWVVVAIDEEKAVLRNTRNVDPREVTVRLQSAIFGLPGGGGGDGGAPAGGGGGRGAQGRPGDDGDRSGGPANPGPAGGK